MARRNSRAETASPLDNDPLWYKDALLYELHVRAFHDSNGDGIGDFLGLTEKLDYLQDLGVTAIWLLPFYPSPLRDDGYDISNYTDVQPAYGTLADFREFLSQAHRRGLRVITELVLNHTSDQHPWFQKARRAKPGSSARNYYVWSDTPDRYKETRIIFKDFEPSNWSWDPVAQAYFWHRFYSHQPDLNFDNPEVHKALFQAMDFWLRMGVDGMRLDAVPYLYEREGTNCENLPDTLMFLRKLRKHVDESFPNRMLLAEANQWPEDAVMYFGEGQACHTAFHFPVMPRMWMSVEMEDRYPMIDILEQTPAIPEGCQWALFLRNHDELTLEMVTDEERDYMYRVYAHDPQARINLGIRRRLAPLLGGDRRKIELMNGLLFSMPGTPIIYYGDEIGMGDNMYLGDRNGVRTPMQWSNDRNAGFSRANPQRLYLPPIIDPDHHYEVVNVEAQRNNGSSLLWWMKRLIALRKRFRAFGRGAIEFLYPETAKILAFVRRYENEAILVVANLSRQAQYVELDLAKYGGMCPVELFGQTEFLPITERPYVLTLTPYAFYWFALETQHAPTLSPVRARMAAAAATAMPVEAAVPHLPVASWELLFAKEGRDLLEDALPEFLVRQRWFGGKARRIKSAELADAIPIGSGASLVYLAILNVDYLEGQAESYVLPLGFAAGERAQELLRDARQQVLASVGKPPDDGIVYDAVRDRAFADALLDAIHRRRRWTGAAGELVASPTREFRKLRGEDPQAPEPAVLRTEQTNSSVVYGSRLILKLFRHIEQGVNPDLEIGAFLTQRARFANTPPVAGWIEYKPNATATFTLGVLSGYVTNEGDAWNFTLDALSRYFERVLTGQTEGRQVPLSDHSLFELAEGDIPAEAHDMIGPYLESARLLGQRSGEMHIALASGTEDPNFVPEPFSILYQRSLYQSMRNLTGRTLQLLRKKMRDLPEAARDDARRVIESEDALLRRFRHMMDRKLDALRTRVHGDYHLGQVLYTGRDFIVIDFEGEPARALSERRLKRSPLRDVAGMLRSFHYAAYAALARRVEASRAEERTALEDWARAWHQWVSSAFLRSYLKTAGEAGFLPRNRAELETLLYAFLLEKAVYEVGYELNHRPDWVRLPLRGILDLVTG